MSRAHVIREVYVVVPPGSSVRVHDEGSPMHRLLHAASMPALVLAFVWCGSSSDGGSPTTSPDAATSSSGGTDGAASGGDAASSGGEPDVGTTGAKSVLRRGNDIQQRGTYT